ncbi:hypothetical protein LINPERPRIM_LOCUS39130 [Linum perenne]
MRLIITSNRVSSLFPDDLLLIEFPSQALCDWVFSRLWHIHNQPLILRRWKVDIAPIVIEPIEVPVWITLRGVPPPLCNHMGVGHLASQIGRPLSKFTRVGTTVKVCVLINQEDVRPSSLMVQVADNSRMVEVEYPEYRSYDKKKVTFTKSKQVYRKVNAEGTHNDGNSAAQEVVHSEEKGDESAIKGDIPTASPTDNEVVTNKGDTHSVATPDKKVGSSGSVPAPAKEVVVSGKGGVQRDEGNDVYTDQEEDTKFDDVEPRAFSPENFPPFKKGGRRGKKTLI